MKLKKFTKTENINKYLLFFISIIFLLLLLKNPFSSRNLIPNLEPFPDTIHYLNPALSLIQGKGLVIEREGRVMNPSVPFLYSLILVPGFLINSDVRFFYLTNIILAFGGLFFFYKFLNKIIPNIYIVHLVLLLFVTNYFVFWLPNLAMAENLILPLFLISLYLLVTKLTIKKAMLAAMLGVSFYTTKYASLVLTVTFLFLYLIKIIVDLRPDRNFKTRRFSKQQLAIPLTFILSSAFLLTIFFLIELLTKGNNILYKIFELIKPIIFRQTATDPASIPVETWFSSAYFNKNIQIYLGAITGNPMRFLWDFTPLLPKYIATVGIIGIIIGFLKPGYRFISFGLTLFIILPIVFISTFYSTDARYIYNAIPSLLAGFGLFLNFAFEFLKEKKLSKLSYLLLIVFFLIYTLSNFYRLKYQIALNLRHSETPWYYVSAKTFDQYFSGLPKTKNPPILITSLPPYYLDFYNTSGFKLLPLSKDQEFRNVKEIAWGANDYNDLIKLYKKYLDEADSLYVTNAGLGNETYLHRDYNLIKENFTLTLVQKGCLETCNIYQLAPKKGMFSEEN